MVVIRKAEYHTTCHTNQSDTYEAKRANERSFQWAENNYAISTIKTYPQREKKRSEERRNSFELLTDA